MNPALVTTSCDVALFAGVGYADEQGALEACTNEVIQHLLEDGG